METEKTEEETFIERKLYLKELRDYRGSLKYTLATTRFTNSTWEENCVFRKRNPILQCAYSSPVPLSSKIPHDSSLFVLEMNNDTNRIMGIGLIKNKPIYEKYVIYKVNNYNRFFYFGKWRIGVEDMTRHEQEIMKIYEDICFNGPTHMKRGQGITAFPLSIQYLCSSKIHLMEYVHAMFKKRIDEYRNAQNKI